MRILVVGHERSATTWVGFVLGATTGAGFVSEPDDARQAPFAIRAMARQGTLPVLGPADPGSRALRRVWDAAFGAQPVRYVRGQHRLSLKVMYSVSDADRHGMFRPTGRVPLRLRLAAQLGVPRHVGYPVTHHVVKSVRAPLMLDWIRARWHPTVVICFRHPLDVVASFLDAGLSTDGLLDRLSAAARSYGSDVYGVPPPTGTNAVIHLAWRVGLVMSVLDDARRADPTLRVLEHADVCEDPVGRLRALVDDVGLEWSPTTETLIGRLNRPGAGFDLSRVASEQSGRWRTRLDTDERRAAIDVLARFPIAARYQADLSA